MIITIILMIIHFHYTIVKKLNQVQIICEDSVL